MKIVFYFLLFILLAPGISSAQTVGNVSPEIVKIEAEPAKGFAYPYYLYVPKAMREEAKDAKKTHTILVIPNNAGKTSDDFTVHEADVKRKIIERWDVSKKLYQDNKLNAEFRLYPNVKHAVTKEMLDDIFAFFSKYIG